MGNFILFLSLFLLISFFFFSQSRSLLSSFLEKPLVDLFFPFSNRLDSPLDDESNYSSKTNINKNISNIIHHSPNSRASQTSCIEIHWWRRGTSLHVCRTIYIPTAKRSFSHCIILTDKQHIQVDSPHTRTVSKH